MGNVTMLQSEAAARSKEHHRYPLGSKVQMGGRYSGRHHAEFQELRGHCQEEPFELALPCEASKTLTDSTLTGMPGPPHEVRRNYWYQRQYSVDGRCVQQTSRKHFCRASHTMNWRSSQENLRGRSTSTFPPTMSLSSAEYQASKHLTQ